MTLAVNISSHGSLCGYNAIASSILLQKKDKREACLAKLSITQEDVNNYILQNEFFDLSNYDQNIIRILDSEDDFDNKLKELFDKSPLEYQGENFSIALVSGASYESKFKNYTTSTSVKLLGALIRFKLEKDSAFKNSVLDCGEEDLSCIYFKNESDSTDKFDHISQGDLMLLFSFFHNPTEAEKREIFIQNPTLEIIQSHESTDLANSSGFVFIFDSPAQPDPAEVDDGGWEVLNQQTGHYNILFSSRIYNERIAEVAGAGAEAEASENNREYLWENLKNLSESVLKLILELCNTPLKTDANLQEVNKNFEKVIENIFPCASPKNNQQESTKTSIENRPR